MNITQEYLQEKYDYDPDSDLLIFKYDANRGKDWNDRNVGKEVSPTYSAGKRYIFVSDALYSYAQIVSIWEGENRRLTKKTTSDLVQENSKLITGLKDLPLEDLKSLSVGMLKGEVDVSDIAKKVTKESNKKYIKKAQHKTRQSKLRATNVSPSKTVSDYFDVNDVATVQTTGLPSNIYLHPHTHKYYVKVSYKGKSHRRAGFNTLNDAFAIRNIIYTQLKDAEQEGVDLAKFEVNIEKKLRIPPKKQTKFNSLSINPITNLPHHIYLRKDTGKYKILITYRGKTYNSGAETYEEALQKRNELYEVLNNGKSANNTRD